MDYEWGIFDSHLLILALWLLVFAASWLADALIHAKGRRAREWDALVRDYRLENVVENHVARWGFWPTATTLTATSNGLHVSLERRISGKGEDVVSIAASGPKCHSPEVTIRPHGVVTALKDARSQRGIEVGSAAFDGRLAVEGPPAFVRALLDERSRNAILALPLSESQVKGDSLRLEVLEHLGSALEMALALAARVSRLADLPAQLAENARRDPLPKVRLANLTTLAAEYPTLELTRQTLRAAMADEDAEVRSRAAARLGEEGHETLVNVACDPHLDEPLAATAVAAMGVDAHPEKAQRVLETSLRTRRLQVARGCIEILGRPAQGRTPALQMLERILSDEVDSLAEAAAVALGRTGEPMVEAALTKALARDELNVRLAAAAALGHVGSAAAVAALRTAGAAGDGALRRKADEAIARIQSRLVGASPGQLSLAAGQGGELSIASAAEGALSLTDTTAPDAPPREKPKMPLAEG